MTKRSLYTNRLANGGKNTSHSIEPPLATNPNEKQVNFSATPVLGLGAEGDLRFNGSMNCNLLEVSEVCNLLKIGRSTLYNLVNQKAIKAVKLLGRTLFRASDVYEFISALPEYEGGPNGF